MILIFKFVHVHTIITSGDFLLFWTLHNLQLTSSAGLLFSACRYVLFMWSVNTCVSGFFSPFVNRTTILLWQSYVKYLLRKITGKQYLPLYNSSFRECMTSWQMTLYSNITYNLRYENLSDKDIKEAWTPTLPEVPTMEMYKSIPSRCAKIECGFFWVNFCSERKKNTWAFGHNVFKTFYCILLTIV